VSTREGYHHGHLREALVDAAIALAAESGPSGVVLRAVTRQVGVSPNAAYRHFADRDALLAEVAHRAMRGLVEAMARRQESVPTDGDPRQRAVERLEAIGRGYVDFALAQPGLFRVCFAAPPELTLGEVPAPSAAADPAPSADGPPADPFGVLNAALDDLVAVGHLPAERRPGAEVLCWSAVHGFATLHLDGPLAGTPDDVREAALTAALAHISLGLGAR
jgi:AcrR family transcriptional regulator